MFKNFRLISISSYKIMIIKSHIIIIFLYYVNQLSSDKITNRFIYNDSIYDVLNVN